MSDSTNTIEVLANQEYKWGFVTDIEADTIPRGLNEDVIRLISAKKNEPEWLLEWRLKAYRHWLTMKEPTWANVHYPPIDYQDIIYYSAPKSKTDGPKSLDEVDPELLQDLREARHPAGRAGAAGGRRGRRGVRQRLGGHHLQGEAEAMGIIFCSFSEAVQEHPDLVRQYLGSVVPYIGQLLRGAQLGGLQRRLVLLRPEGRALPDGAVHLLPHQRQGHRPVRAHADRRRRRRATSATSKAARRRCATRTSCTRRWWSWWRSTTRRSSIRRCRTGIPATRKARAASTTSSPSAAHCRGVNSKISWTQVETGSAITWKYPSCILHGRQLGRRVLLGGADQQLPAGRHRHEDDPHREEHDAARSSRRASRPATGRTPIAAW